MNSIDNPTETAKKPGRSSLDDVLDGALAREVDEHIARPEERSAEAGGESGDSGDSGNDEPPTSRRTSIPLGPQFALRIGDGAILMAVEGHADDRDLAGREVWPCFVLTPSEAKLARATINHAEHNAAAHIAVKLPKKP